ncbi:hypothetical protein E2C01_077245 [Portunus trituberculatus]|uniref:Uncharacterized protein n=1 Tax=Portunus trituberculatus TaxID=210409 RepID=A0A5B7IAX8_PORTR|nr:hypothetical protein [Portunus trituberculatus]
MSTTERQEISIVNIWQWPIGPRQQNVPPARVAGRAGGGRPGIPLRAAVIKGARGHNSRACL